MKKLLTLATVLSLSATITLAATTGLSVKEYAKQQKALAKQEAKAYNASLKEAVKKDIEAKTKASEQAQIKAAAEKKNAKLKEFNSKITELNKEKAKIQAAKDMTYTEKALKTKAIDKQLEFYKKQVDALK